MHKNALKCRKWTNYCPQFLWPRSSGKMNMWFSYQTSKGSWHATGEPQHLTVLNKLSPANCHSKSSSFFKINIHGTLNKIHDFKFSWSLLHVLRNLVAFIVWMCGQTTNIQFLFKSILTVTVLGIWTCIQNWAKFILLSWSKNQSSTTVRAVKSILC